YTPLDTRNHRVMDRESDHFAACLLLEAERTAQRLTQLGFDLIKFARERERSLPAVVLRAQEIWSRNSRLAGPVGGAWLYEAPRQLVEARRHEPADLVVGPRAHFAGFSAR